MTKIDQKHGRRRGRERDASPMNSILAAATTAHELEAGHKMMLEAEKKRALAKKLANRTRGK